MGVSEASDTKETASEDNKEKTMALEDDVATKKSEADTNKEKVEAGVKTEKSDNSEVEVAKPEEKDEVMEIKSASSKVEFSDQKSQDIPSEMSLSMSGSFAKSETSVTSPTKSSSTEGAVSPSIEDKSKASETVSVAISIDPCTLAQGYEDLKGKAGAKSITSPDTPQQNAPIADENLNTSQQDTAKDKQSEDPDTKPAQTDSDPCQSGPESETTTQGNESKVEDESNMVTSQTGDKDSKIAQEQEKVEQIDDKLEAMKDATEEYKDNLKGNGDKTSDSKVSLESVPPATTSDNKDSAQESTSAIPETSSATPVSVSAAPESASDTQEPALAESKADEEVAKWGKPLPIPSPVNPNGGLGSSRSLNNDTNNKQKTARKAEKKITPVYMDLAYVPHHGDANYTDIEFFKRVRARYYVFSGVEPSRAVFDALLEAKKLWENKDLEVTIIPTYDSDVLGYWVADNEDALTEYKIDLAPSASRCTINLQDHETSCAAYRLEF